MATLQSPGVQVSIVNESFYTPAAPGTVPLIFVASAENKLNQSGAIATGTLPANAGKVYLLTGQRDLTDTFGTPLFYTDANSNPIHGGELNEYGLQAAYSLLGVSSAAYVARAPVDLASLVAKSSIPAGAPADGTYWVDTTDSLYGIFEWNKTKGVFTNKVPLIVDDSNASVAYSSANSAPANTYGLIGEYAVVLNRPSTSTAQVYYKNTDANWVEVGSETETSFVSNSNVNTFVSTVWSTSFPVVTGKPLSTTVTVSTASTFTINGTSVGIATGDTVSDIAKLVNSAFHTTAGVGAKVVSNALALYVDSGSFPDVTLVVSSDLVAQLGISSGTYKAPTVFVGPHTQYPDFTLEPSGSIYVKTTTPNTGANWVVKQWNSTSNAWNTIKSPIYGSTQSATYYLDTVGGGANIPVGTLFIESNYTHGDNSTTASSVIASYKLRRRAAVAPTTITSAPLGTNVTFGPTDVVMLMESTVAGKNGFASTASISLTTSTTNGLAALVQGINNSGLANIKATLNEVVADTTYSITITHTTGGEIRFTDTSGVLSTVGFATNTSTSNLYTIDYTVDPSHATHLATNWQPLTFVASPTAPTSNPTNGKLWYSSITDQVDIMVHDGTKWRGYREIFPNTDKNGPLVSSSRPTTQSDGVTALANGDIWISMENGVDRYGKDIYVYDGNTLSWVLQDITDQTSPTGWLFADARWATNGSASAPSTIPSLLLSSYVDPDAPDPTEYPRGMRLWNLRRSGFNVKQYKSNYIDITANNGTNIRYNNEPMDSYFVDRWVSVSPNNANGSGTFGRYAQRGYVVSAFKELIDSNQAVRDTDTLNFNLIATPGYPEAIQNMISLNTDRGLTAFVVGDTSFRLKPTGTDLAAYGLNSNGAVDNGEDGLVSYNEYMSVFYPSGYTNDLTGNYIVVPPSHMMLRTIALSDQQSYPWFAPAGIRRGVVDNVTSVGYINNGEFVPTALPQNIRDVMAQNGHINPIATLTGAGIVNFAQYTRANAASSLDRINAVRLVAYVRRQLDILTRPFLFEPNDKVTRNEVKTAIQKFFLELVGQRALYDFVVVCDETNNTPARIDRNELWADAAFEIVRAAEYIYVPIRIVNTGDIASGNYTIG